MKLHSKQDFQALLFKILAPVRSCYSEENARIRIGKTGVAYGSSTAEMEAFSRSFWGLAPFFYGGGKDADFQNKCLTGLIHGTTPENSEYWGNNFDNIDQRFCEMAALATGLLLIPEKLWLPLSEKEKDNLATWLDSINHYTLGNNNWQFFAVLVNVALKKLGRNFSQETLENSLNTIESFYLGDGWYRDGVLQNKDYYIPFAFHFYGLLYSVFMADEDPDRCARLKERAYVFGQQFIYWFDKNGDSVPYGRSLTYRFAQVSFFSACLFADIKPVPINVMKGIIVRNLTKWFDSDMFDSSGYLSIGYKYPNLIMAENYNAPGSPLWSLKAFLFLALDDNHPFWTADVAPLPEMDPVFSIPKAEMIISRDQDSVTMYPSGGRVIPPAMGHMAEKYSKFAYSTKYGFSIQKAYDCGFALPAEIEDLTTEVDETFAEVISPTGKCIVSGGQGIIIDASPNTNLMTNHTVIPAVSYHINTGTTELNTSVEFV